MRAELTIRDALAGMEQTVVVEGPADMTADALGKLLASRSPSSGPLFLDGVPLVGDQPVASLPPLDGAVVTVHQPGPERPRLDGLRVLVMGGPDAGGAVPVPAEGVVGGRGSECRVRTDDLALRRTGDFGLVPHEGRVFLSDVGSANGVFHDGRRVGEHTQIQPGARWFAGQSEFVLRTQPIPEAGVRPGADGSLVFTRQFRSIPRIRTEEVEWPHPPGSDEKMGFPWLQVLLPAVFFLVMIGLFVYSGRDGGRGFSPIYLVFAALAPIMSTVGIVTERKRRTKQLAARHDTYDRAYRATEAKVLAAIGDELAVRQQRVPSVAELTESAVMHGARIWERRPRDDDYLELRVGTADIPATSVVTRGTPVAPPTLRSAPVSLRLDQLGCIGLYGPDHSVRGLARSLVAQIATLHGPDDVQLTFLLRDAAHEDWEWVRWLPHARREGGAVVVGLDRDSTEHRIAELATLVDHREAERRPGGARQAPPLPSVVAVVEDASELRDSPLMSRVLARGAEVGVYVIACERRRALLPQECRAAVEVTEPERFNEGTVEVQAVETLYPVRLDAISAATAEVIARRLTPLRLAGETSESVAGIPSVVRLLDLTGHRDGSAARLKAKWDLGGRTTALKLGQGQAGEFVLDIKEHGPHALVAGTTGSGKSQLLMSLVLGLALENTPEDLSFVLVDFKGGGAFEACADLPHTARMVTNLGGGEARRAVTALRSESLRRQELFAPFGADIDNYERARRAGDARAGAKVPRLMIIVDEFAQLAEEHEDLLDEFVNVARVGRSLGMHMVLATQRPSGIISPQIRSNCDLRIALRVTDPSDSVDVIDKPDAAKIASTARGRAYVRAADELFEVQTAAVGLPVPGVAATVASSSIVLRPWIETPNPISRGPASSADLGQLETDLQVGVQLVQKACALGGYVIPPSPVLPSLPESIVLGELPGGRPGAAPIGIEDRPAEQLQRPFDVHPADGHLLLVGTSRSGRTTAIRTLVASLACSWEPNDLHVYGFDFGGGGLRTLETLPHVGAIVGQNQVDRARRLANRLGALVQERMRIFQQQGVGDLTEQRASGNPPLPWVTVVVDRWDVLLERESGGGELANALRRLITEGAAFGISVVMSSDSRRARALTADISNSLCFTLNDKAEYTDFGIKSKEVPDSIPPGRALRGGEATEVQVALLAGDPSAAAQSAAVDRLASHFSPNVSGPMPFRVDELPARITLGELAQLPRPIEDGVPLAAGGDTLAAVAWSPREQPVLVVAGPPGSGRTTVLENAISWVETTAKVAVVDPSSGRLAARRGIASVQSGMEARSPKFDDVLAWEDKVLVVIDDLDQIMDDSRLVELLGDRPANVAIACAVNAESLKMAMRGAMGTLARSRAGLLLNPQGLQHRGLFGLNSLDRSDVISDAPGKGYWVDSGGLTLVQVATAE